MRRGFKYWWKDHKRAALLAALLGVLFDVANIDWVSGVATWFPGNWPGFIILLASAIIAGALGLLVMAFTVWPLCAVLLFASLIGSIGYKILNEPLSESGLRDRNEGVCLAALGITIAYWIGYKFYMLWIK